MQKLFYYSNLMLKLKLGQTKKFHLSMFRKSNGIWLSHGVQIQVSLNTSGNKWISILG